ncbi:DUF3618 domain-containing protein [Microbispora sp. H11081]|uniref:DUF3618 domain-containing protein n=1 Tax=Microbispora sp. H11081 TaxID=2729107 RepID=UPI0014736A2E|nr:DUF3618 domain-containing protein [Microbispora sp. H11081]
MTETEPGAARPNAGAVGVHRQDVSEPVTEPESLNAVRQSRPGPEPVAAARDTGTRREGAEKKGHDEIAEVRQEIERTRDHLGDTIEALAAKADVKARAQERVHATAAAARAKVAGVTGRMREAAPERVRGAAGRMREATPERVRGAAGMVGEQARRRSGLIAAAGAAGTALLLLRRLPRSQGRTPGQGMQGMIRGLGAGRMGAGTRRFKTSGTIGRPTGGYRVFTAKTRPTRGHRVFTAKTRSGGMGRLWTGNGRAGKGAFGGLRASGRTRMPGLTGMSGRKRTPGLKRLSGMPGLGRLPGLTRMSGRKAMFGGTGRSGRRAVFGGRGTRGLLSGRPRVFAGRRLFPRSRHTLMRRFAHR